ncbi:hypothetical protein [Nocardia asteroides]|uniref:hypothetical protein n=1 Tax=Nocardia asteroides TaxID=1824 RepID=UPI0033F1A8CA
MSNQPSVEDEITREAARFGRTALAVVQSYQQRHPGKRLPHSVQREAHRAFRGEMKAQQARVKAERGQVQLDITEQVRMHANAAISARRNPASTPEGWAEQQWQLDQRRMQLERAIQTAPHLSREERGQAVTALVASHYADNPRVKQPPVFGGKLAGVKALRARLADRLSQAKLSLAEQLDPSRGKGQQQPGRRMPATTIPLPVHPYWQRSRGDFDAQAHRIEQQQRRLAEQAQREMRVIAERDQLRIERDQLRNQVSSMGEQLGEAARQNRGLAEDLAQRGQELTAAHQQVGRVTEQRDAAVQKVATMTAPADRLGSPERQAAAAQPQAPQVQRDPQKPVTLAELDQLDGILRGLGVPEDLRARVTGEEVREKVRARLETPAVSVPEAPEAPEVEATPEAPEAPETPEAPQAESAPKAPASRRTGSRSRKSPAAPEKELVGAAPGGGNGGSTRRVNGSRKAVSAPAAPEIPLPPEPPAGFEPPDIDDMFDR